MIHKNKQIPTKRFQKVLLIGILLSFSNLNYAQTCTVTAAINASPTCVSTVMIPIIRETTEVTGIGTPTGLPAGVTASWSSNKITISGTPSAAGTYSYTIPLLGCGSSATGTITVVSSISITKKPVSTSACLNDTASFIAETELASPNYQWGYSTTSSGSWTSLGASTTGFSHTQESALNVTASANLHNYYFSCVITQGTCTATSTPVRLTVGNTPTNVTISPANQTVCEGNNVTLVASSPDTAVQYRLVLKSAYGEYWHAIKEIKGIYGSDSAVALTGVDGSSATYSDNPITGGDPTFKIAKAFDSDENTQWLTPSERFGTAPLYWGATLPNTNWQNYATFNKFYTPEWIEFTSPQVLSGIKVLNGGYSGHLNEGIRESRYKHYDVLISYDSGTTWSTIKRGQFADSPNVNIISLEPSYTWKKGTTTVGTGKTLTINGITTSQAGTYKLELGYGCNVRTLEATIAVQAKPSAKITTANTALCHGNSLSLNGTVTATGAWTMVIRNSADATTMTLTGTGNDTWNSVVNPNVSATYTINSIADASGCTGTVSGSTAITLPTIGTQLSANNVNATCQVKENNFIHFYASGRLLASINSNGQNLGNVSITSYLEDNHVSVPACDDPTNPLYISATMKRHWVITPEFTPVNNISVRLPFDNAEFTTLQTIANSNQNPNDNLASLASVNMSKYSGPNNVNNTFNDNCTNFPVTPGNGGTTVHTQTGNGAVTSFNALFDANGKFAEYSISPKTSEFWLHGGSSSPLPVTLTNFSASCDQNVTLNWSTASEQNSDKFILEKSRDGLEWIAFAEQAAAGNSNTNVDYQQVDNNTWNGITYYRLRQLDFNGEQEVFGPISTSCEGNISNSMVVYPNPNNGSFTVEITSKEAHQGAELLLTDITGKVIHSQRVNIDLGKNQLLFNHINLQKGTYLATLKGVNGELKPVRILVGF
ncbi:MAG: T9SS type A sorting domain-containing protein [Crocinitomicaceae bacterium]|nr:T9SS type A sorting domain-containing protein [Crocinitomicaceae bacterium]